MTILLHLSFLTFTFRKENCSGQKIQSKDIKKKENIPSKQLISFYLSELFLLKFIVHIPRVDLCDVCDHKKKMFFLTGEVSHDILIEVEEITYVNKDKDKPE